ncbi:MAG: BMC domain-containing protein [Oligoflexia bacterium]|nr:BMC domain-containing protein [Oligoflexia bacterium]
MIYGPAICALELSSIALGYSLIDKAVKKAPVKILEGSALTPGKFFILLNGDEASIEEARGEMHRLIGQCLLDDVYIPQLHEEVLPALYSQSQFKVEESLAIIETATICSGFLSSDAAVKNADVHLIDFKIARGIGGKSYFFVTGKLEEVAASVEAVNGILSTRGTLLRTEIIARPHDDFLTHFF